MPPPLPELPAKKLVAWLLKAVPARVPYNLLRLSASTACLEVCVGTTLCDCQIIAVNLSNVQSHCPQPGLQELRWLQWSVLASARYHTAFCLVQCHDILCHHVLSR